MLREQQTNEAKFNDSDDEKTGQSHADLARKRAGLAAKSLPSNELDEEN